MSQTPLSIVLLTYNTQHLILSCLASLAGMAKQKGWQIIVVDNGSTDGSAVAIAEMYPQVDLITSSVNLGYAGGNNLGLIKARGDVVILLNSDVVVEASVLAALADYLQTHPDVGAVSPRLLTKEGLAQPFAFGEDPTLTYLVRRAVNRLLRRGALHNWAVGEAIDVDWISGACFCIPRSVIEEVGLLDDGFFLYFEDNDWCLRIRAAGRRIVYHPAWSVVHLGGGSQPGGRGSSSLYYDSLLYFYRKHYPWWQRQGLAVALALYRRLIAR